MIKKYFLQILVVLLMLSIAWILLSLNGERPKIRQALNNPIQANIQQSAGDKSENDINPEFYPIRNWLIDEPEILAEAAVILNFKNDNFKNNILYQKNINQIMPIASLTKIMTAIVALENLNPDEVIEVSENSVAADGDKGGLINGEKLKVKDLLYIMLMESSNDAAMALAQNNSRLTYEEFINLMNIKANELGLKNTIFKDPTGLMPENESTVLEIAELTKYTFNFYLISEILKTNQITISSLDNDFVHSIANTNKLLGKLPQIIGGKTGFTEEANGCMMILYKNYDESYLIIVVLGSSQRENDVEKLIDWAQRAYVWQ